MWKAKAKQTNKKLEFLGSGSHTQEQAYVRIIKPVCASNIMYVSSCPKNLTT